MVGEYGRTVPDFWTGDTGRAMAKLDPMVQLVAHYLFSGHYAFRYGIYREPASVMALEMGRPLAAVAAALVELERLRYAFYDAATSYVWVPTMAAYQIVPFPLKPGDKRVPHVRTWYRKMPDNCPYLGEFFDRYAGPLLMTDATVWEQVPVCTRRGPGAPPGPIEVEPPASVAEPLSFALVPWAAQDPHVITAVEQDGIDFDTWWGFYPNKTGKKESREIWMKMRPSRGTPLAEMLEVLERQKRSPRWREDQGKYIIDPERYLKRERWKDEAPMELESGPVMSTNTRTTANAIREREEEDRRRGASRLDAITVRPGSPVPQHKQIRGAR